MASCSLDGKVAVNFLFGQKLTTHDYGQPLTCVALDPDYVKNKERYICGGKSSQLIMREKGTREKLIQKSGVMLIYLGWFGGTNSTVIHKGEGTIHAVAWGTDLIAWANDIGVKVYDCNSKERLTYIDRPRGSPKPEQ